MLLSRPLPLVAAAAALLLLAGPADAAPASDTPTVTVSIAATGTATTAFCDPATGERLGAPGASLSREVGTTRATAAAPPSARVGVSSTAPGPVTVVASVGSVRSATSTASFSDPPPPCGPVPSVTVSPPVVLAGAAATATVTGTPGTTVQLYAYSRPSTTYRLARQALVPPGGRLDLVLRPSGSTRLYAVQRYCTVLSASRVVGVRSPVSLTATRLAALTYRFAGSTGGAPVGTAVLLYRRTPTGDVLLARTSTTGSGTWAVTRAFAAPQRLVVLARTTATAIRLAGTSPLRTTAVR